MERMSLSEAERLESLGQQALRAGDLAGARTHLHAAAQAAPNEPQRWLALAMVEQRRGDAAAEESALSRALEADPYHLMALALRGRFYERLGQRHDAAAAYAAAIAVAPPDDQLPRELAPAVAHARRYREQHDKQLAHFIDRQLEAALDRFPIAELDRFRLSLDILLGRKKRYDAQPMRFFFPRLVPIEFFERSRFPWLDAVEAATDEIRAEFLAVLREDAGFEPYIQYGADQPVAQWKELNHSPRWSAFHLWKDGQPVAEHVARCPRTDAVLNATPRPEQAGKTPVAMYSLLKPRTRIPPHVGASNARLVCHLPLIIPAGCGFRVGNTTREWVPGRAWVFDDTIEHEAWNESDELRVVLIWDTWHPDLTEPERQMITALNAALQAFSAGDAGWGG